MTPAIPDFSRRLPAGAALDLAHGLMEHDRVRDHMTQEFLAALRDEAAAFKSTNPNIYDIVCYYQDWGSLSGWGVKGTSASICEGLGIPIHTISMWRRHILDGWDPRATNCGGLFTDFIPRQGFVVYAIYDTAGSLVYIGRTRNPKHRLTRHRTEKGPEAAHRWEIWNCATEREMCDLEAILIAQHRPPLNKRIEERNGAAT